MWQYIYLHREKKTMFVFETPFQWYTYSKKYLFCRTWIMSSHAIWHNSFLYIFRRPRCFHRHHPLGHRGEEERAGRKKDGHPVPLNRAAKVSFKWDCCFYFCGIFGWLDVWKISLRQEGTDLWNETKLQKKNRNFPLLYGKTGSVTCRFIGPPESTELEYNELIVPIPFPNAWRNTRKAFSLFSLCEGIPQFPNFGIVAVLLFSLLFFARTVQSKQTIHPLHLRHSFFSSSKDESPHFRDPSLSHCFPLCKGEQ